MDFFTRQDNARKRTKWLVLYFILAVIFTIGLIYLACALIFLRGHAEEGGLGWLWNGQLFAGVTALTLFIILCGNIYKISALSKGGSSVARLLGGRPINANTTDPDERKLMNVVEEMAIASGTPVPDVYVLPQENGINAFAAGHSSQDAAVGVTRGCMQLLTRDELQGVIAHEFSHILNGDMNLNIRLIGIVHGLVCVALLGKILLQTGYYSSGRHRHRHRHYMLGARSSGKGGNPLPLLGLALLVIGGIGIFFGRLIKSAVSRQREYLADASAVQFTRNPPGLAGALKKIGGLARGSRLQSSRAEEASHMFFGNGLKPSWMQALATHPPLLDRIKAIDPNFDGTFPVVQAPSPEPEPEASKDQKKTKPPPLGIPPILPIPPISQLLGDQGASPNLAPSAPASVPAAVSESEVMAQIGSPTQGHLDFAVQLMAAMPLSVSDSVRDPTGAVALVYLLLLSPAQSVQQSQLKSLQERIPNAILDQIQRLKPEVSQLDKKFRLPLVELTLSALRGLSPSQYQEFLQTMKWLVESDDQLDLFEYALQKMVVRHLKPHFEPVRKRALQFYSLKPLVPDVAVLASSLAHAGHDDPGLGQQSFSKGLQRLPVAHRDAPMIALDQCRLEVMDQALDRLSQASPRIKKVVLEVCLDTVAADGILQLSETELLRAIADSLDCPIPPLLANA